MKKIHIQRRIVGIAGCMIVILAFCIGQAVADVVTLSGTNTVQDTYLRGDDSSGSQRLNLGGANNLLVGRLEDGATFQKLGNTLLRFDVSSLAGQTVSDVTLRLFNLNDALQTADVTINVYEVAAANGDWVEGDGLAAIVSGTSDWRFKIDNTGDWAGGHNGCGVAGTDYTTALVGSAVSADTTAQWVEFTLSAAVIQNWIDNPSQNYGLVLTSPGALQGEAAFFVSSESGTNGPELQVTVIPEPTTVGLFLISSAGVLLLRRASFSK